MGMTPLVLHNRHFGFFQNPTKTSEFSKKEKNQKATGCKDAKFVRIN